MALQAHHDAVKEYERQVLEDIERVQAMRDAIPGCPDCGRLDRMANYSADLVLWIISNEDEASYDRCPLYRWGTRGCYLYSLCTACNRQRIVPAGYKRLTMEQARLWALRQRRLERRAANG